MKALARIYKYVMGNILRRNNDLELKNRLVKESKILQDKVKQQLQLFDPPEILEILSYLKRDPANEVKGKFYIAGADLSYARDDITACVALVVLDLCNLELIYEDFEKVEITTPYIAGCLASREGPPILNIFKKLEDFHSDIKPKVLMVDGNGNLHESGCGIACHIGVHLDMPTIGVTKNLLHVDGLKKDNEKINSLINFGDSFPLVGQSGNVLGYALKSNDSCKNPVYVSVGNKITLDSALQIVKHCCKYRIPEPIRQADILSREYVRSHMTV